MSNKVETNDKYYEEVILAGDEASGEFKGACKEANEAYSLAKKLGILEKDGSINIDHSKMTVSKMKIDTDGVGTKTQIYCNQFENVFQLLEKQKISGEEAKKQAVELRYRMLMDLAAMVADDMRNGEVPIAMTNIIDINHLKGPRGKLFQDSMAEAMKRAIKKTGIAMTAGETAVMGENRKTVKINKIRDRRSRDILAILAQSSDKESIDRIKEILQEEEKEVNIVMQGIDFNIGGSILGLKTEDKLTNLEESYYDFTCFEENDTDGIIGPRANGITKIRDDMELILGDEWENKTFEDFVQKIGAEKSNKIPQEVKNVCKGKQMRDIATGETTVFSPFITNTLLGGLEGKPKARIARLMHVTGNPRKKISEGIDSNDYVVNVTTGQLPQIIVLLQIALDIPDEQAANKWNMSIPYAMLTHPSDRPTIAQLAQEHGFKLPVRGSATKKRAADKEKKNTIHGVGIGRSTITF